MLPPAAAAPTPAAAPSRPRVSVADFAAEVKRKYPEYAEVDDVTLTKAVVEKYPEYGEQVDMGTVPAVGKVEAVMPPEAPSVGGFVKNIWKSGAKLATDVASAVTSPVKTGTAIAQVVGGGIEKLQAATGLPDPSGGKNIPTFDAMTEHFKQRYGGVEEIKKTAYEDPVGFLVDLSAVLTGGGSAAAKMGIKAGTTVAKIGSAIDPIAATVRGATKAAPIVAEKVVAPILGKTTGTGTEAIKEAAKATPEFQKGLREVVDHEDIVTDVRKAVGDLAEARATEYQAALAALPPTQVTTKPVIAALRDAVAQFGGTIKVVKDKKGNVTGYKADFTGPNSKIVDSGNPHMPDPEIAAIQGIVDDVAKNAVNGSADMLTLDALKQRIGQRMGAGSRSDKILTATRDAAKQALEQGVPGYADMTKGYAEASALLDKLTTEFSVSGKAGKTGTSIRKLTNALNQRNEFRRTLIEVMDNELGTNIKGALAGAEMSSKTPRGLMGPLAGAGTLAAFTNPALLAGLAFTSPRLVGEALVAISKARKSKAAAAVSANLPKNPAVPAAVVRAVGEEEQ
jgi:hypothetical protein